MKNEEIYKLIERAQVAYGGRGAIKRLAEECGYSYQHVYNMASGNSKAPPRAVERVRAAVERMERGESKPFSKENETPADALELARTVMALPPDSRRQLMVILRTLGAA